MAGSGGLNFCCNEATISRKHPQLQLPTTTTMSSSNEVIANSLPPENDLGNIEYKSQLINPTSSRLQHLRFEIRF